MVIPAAMNIEVALDTLPKIDQRWRDDQLKELSEGVGESSAIVLGVAFPLSDEFKRGYELGIQTARNMVAGSAEILLKGGDPVKVL